MIVKVDSWKLYVSLIIIYLIFFLPQELILNNIMVKTEPIAPYRVVVIDPGHGGVDGGTNYNDLLEKNINLEISLKLRDYLEAHNNIKVIMTRKKDIALDHLNNYSSSRHIRDLRARLDIINQQQVDLFISLHVDYRNTQPSMKGPVVLYHLRHPQNKILATLIQKHLNQLNYPGTNYNNHQPLRRRDLYILKAKYTPGVLIELGFITNHQDRRLLQNSCYQDALVEAIYYGIKDYFSGFNFLIDN